jgi:flagellar protein FlaG
MDINFLQGGQNFAETNVSTVNKATNTLTEGQAFAAAQEKPAEQAKVSRLSVENSKELKNVQDDVAIEKAVSEISEFVNANNRQLNFSIDEGSDRPVVKVTDAESGKIVRQIPSEEVLRLSERLKDFKRDVGSAVGVLFNKQV